MHFRFWQELVKGLRTKERDELSLSMKGLMAKEINRL